MSTPKHRAVRAAGVATGALLLVSGAAVPTASAAPVAAPRASAPAVTAAAAPADPTSTYTLHRGEQLVRQGTSTTQPSFLRAGGLKSGPNQTVNTGNGTYLVLQSDGNLVEYETTTGAVLFATMTWTGTNRGSKLVYQDDGNIVLYSDAGVPLWNTGTRGDTRGEVFASYGNGQLVIQDGNGGIVRTFGPAVTPGPGVMIGNATSPNGHYRLAVQTDGNLVAYAGDRPFWFTNTRGAGKVRLIAQSDGNLVLYSYATGAPVWYSGTAGIGGGIARYYQLDLQDDGNIVLYLTDGRNRTGYVWASNTRGVV